MALQSLTRVLALALMLTAVTAGVVLASPTTVMTQVSGDVAGGCVLGPLCGLGDLGSWLQQTVQHIVGDFLGELVNGIGTFIIGSSTTSISSPIPRRTSATTTTSSGNWLSRHSGWQTVCLPSWS